MCHFKRQVKNTTEVGLRMKVLESEKIKLLNFKGLLFHEQLVQSLISLATQWHLRLRNFILLILLNINNLSLHYQVAKKWGLEILSLWQRLNFFLEVHNKLLQYC